MPITVELQEMPITVELQEIPITVELQDMHSYSPVVFIVIFSIIAISIITFLVVKILKHRSTKVEAKPRFVVNKGMLKHKYMMMINDVEAKYRDNVITNRYAYEELSRIVRSYVYEATGVKTHNYTLNDIGKSNMPNLYTMIDECYVPEFSINSSGNVYDSANRARKVIQEWN